MRICIVRVDKMGDMVLTLPIIQGLYKVHNNKIDIVCSRSNLKICNKLKIINKILDSNFYDELNDDFKNSYNSPGDIISLNSFFINNNIQSNITIEDLLKLIIEKKIYKKDIFLKDKLSFLVELYFNKKFFNFKSRINTYSLYKYFLSKIYECNKYNLNIENVLIELNGKLLNE